jgi:hypothetical protein
MVPSETSSPSCAEAFSSQFLRSVTSYVHRSVGSPLFLTFLEESTRSLRALHMPKSFPKDSDSGVARTKSSPCGNYLLVRSDVLATLVEAERDATRVAFVGGTGFLGKFIAEEMFSRGLGNLTVYCRNGHKAREILGAIFTGEVERRRSAAAGFVQLQLKPPAEETAATAKSERRGLRIIEGSLADAEGLRSALHGTDIVFYLASGRRTWPAVLGGGWSSRVSHADLEGFRQTVAAAALADSHVVLITSVCSRKAWYSPTFIFSNWIAHRPGYLAAQCWQERELLNDDGTAPVRWSEQSSPAQPRFSIFRVRNYLTHPTTLDHFTLCRAMDLTGDLPYLHYPGDVAARVFSQLVLRGVGSQRSLAGARLDVAMVTSRRAGEKGRLTLGHQDDMLRSVM